MKWEEIIPGKLFLENENNLTKYDKYQIGDRVSWIVRPRTLTPINKAGFVIQIRAYPHKQEFNLCILCEESSFRWKQTALTKSRVIAWISNTKVRSMMHYEIEELLTYSDPVIRAWAALQVKANHDLL